MLSSSGAAHSCRNASPRSTHAPRHEHGTCCGASTSRWPVDGEDWSEVLGRGPVRPDMAAEVTAQIRSCPATRTRSKWTSTASEYDARPLRYHAQERPPQRAGRGSYSTSALRRRCRTRKLTQTPSAASHTSPERSRRARHACGSLVCGCAVLRNAVGRGRIARRTRTSSRSSRDNRRCRSPTRVPSAAPLRVEDVARGSVAALSDGRRDPSDLLARQGRQTEAEREWTPATADEVTLARGPQGS
jgi:hypothetical protein